MSNILGPHSILSSALSSGITLDRLRGAFKVPKIEHVGHVQDKCPAHHTHIQTLVYRNFKKYNI